MIKRRLGRSALEVGPLAFGGFLAPALAAASQSICARSRASETVSIAAPYTAGGRASNLAAGVYLMIAAIASVAAIAPLTHKKGSVSAATHRRRTSRRKRACSPQLASAWRLR